MRHLRNGLKQCAVTGTRALAKVIRAVLVVGTMSAASVVAVTEPKIGPNVKQPSTLDNSREQRQLKAAAHKAQEAQATGTCQLKRRADEQLSEIPRYKRGFVWNNLLSSPSLSPSALATETASPLASPPSHLLNDPALQATLHTMNGHIRVKTPFNVDRFESMLYDHPDQPFVQSVMNGLCFGFWPFDEGNWKDDQDEAIKNYTSEEIDYEAVRAFRDDEIEGCRWSGPIASHVLLPGMKLSPIFVAWQKGKARIITDHTASGLNEHIPRSEAKVVYDDMHSFGQVIFNTKRAHPHHDLVTWKSDVSSAFLNLPAHPIYQLRQDVEVEGAWHLIRRLVFGNCASPRCWCSVSGLMCWIGIRKFGISDLHDFMDDFFSWGTASDLIKVSPGLDHKLGYSCSGMR